MDYDPNGIVMNPADYATLLAACTADSQSCGVTYTNNEMFINGVPVFKASWVTAGDYVVGDWSYARKIVVDGLAVEFFEQDQDNVIKNMITARVEARVCFAVEAPACLYQRKDCSYYLIHNVKPANGFTLVWVQSLSFIWGALFI